MLWYLIVNFLLVLVKLSAYTVKKPLIIFYSVSSWNSRLGHIHLRGFFLHPMRDTHCRKSTKDREGIRYRNYNGALRTILTISKGFHRSYQKNLSIYFSLWPCSLKIKKKNSSARGRKPRFKFINLKKNIFFSWPSPFKQFEILSYTRVKSKLPLPWIAGFLSIHFL